VGELGKAGADAVGAEPDLEPSSVISSNRGGDVDGGSLVVGGNNGSGSSVVFANLVFGSIALGFVLEGMPRDGLGTGRGVAHVSMGGNQGNGEQEEAEVKESAHRLVG